MINRTVAIGKYVAGFLVVAGWLTGTASAYAQETGKQIFEQSCEGCHSIGDGVTVGPDLIGELERHPEDWLIKFIKSPQALAKSGDKDAKAALEEFKDMPMPDFALSDDQIRKVLAYIKEAGSGRTASKEAPAAKTASAAAPPSPDAIQLGQDLFEGKVRFANAGPSCNACHHVASDALLGGGVLASELTLVFSRMGGKGLRAILGSSPFPVMQAAYSGKAFSDTEISALVGFLQHADQEHARQMPKEWGLRIFSAGTGGLVVLLGIVALAGRRRKKVCVNQDIYDRQTRSE